MTHTTRLYPHAPRPDELTPKQRRRVRDLLAFVHVTGRRAGGLVAKYKAAQVVSYATDYTRESMCFLVDSRALSDYDVTNHPFVNLAAILATRGYRYNPPRRHGRAQKWITYRRIDHEPGTRHDEITLGDVSSAVWISGTHPAGTFALLRGYAKQVGCSCYDRFSEVEEAVA